MKFIKNPRQNAGESIAKTTYTTEVDRPRSDVDVHEIVDNSALQMIGDSVHVKASPDVDDLDVRELPASSKPSQFRKVNLEKLFLIILKISKLRF